VGVHRSHLRSFAAEAIRLRLRRPIYSFWTTFYPGTAPVPSTVSSPNPLVPQAFWTLFVKVGEDQNHHLYLFLTQVLLQDCPVLRD